MRILVNLPTNNWKMAHEFADSWIENKPEGYDVHMIVNGPDYSTFKRFPYCFQRTEVVVNPRAVSMLDLRAESITSAAMIDYDYICLMDDDLLFSTDSKKWLARMRERLMSDEPTVLSTFGNNGPSDFTYDPEDCIITTNRGLFIRTDALKGFRLATQRNLLGGSEESVLAYYALSNHYSHLSIGGSPIQRRNKKHFEFDSESPIHNLATYIDNVRKYVRDYYGDQEWDCLTGKLPRDFHYEDSD